MYFAMRLFLQGIDIIGFLCNIDESYVLSEIIERPMLSIDEFKKINDCILVASIFDKNMQEYCIRNSINNVCYDFETINPALKDMKEVALYGAGENAEIGVLFGKPGDNYLENSHKIIPNYSTEKLEKMGWKPRIGIQEGFSRTIAAIITNMR